jgi:rod shape-determining protein MreC
MPPKKKESYIYWIAPPLALALLLLLFLAHFLTAAADYIAGGFMAPFTGVSSRADKWFAEKSLLVKSKSELAGSLEVMRKKNIGLSAELSSMRRDAEENIKLRTLLSLRKAKGYGLIFAAITVRNPYTWRERFTVDKGSEDGLTPGAAVIACARRDDPAGIPLAVIGRIHSVTKHSAVVRTLLSDDIKMSVTLSKSGAAGIAQRGDGSLGGFKIDITYISRNSFPQTGEYVFTSGLSPNTPPGLYIGIIPDGDQTAVRLKNNMWAEAKVDLAADFDNPGFVAVMVPENPAQ